MKILVANLGSTSLKWRLFDVAEGGERLLHKGGIERVTDYSRSIDDCLRQLHEAGHLTGEGDLAAVGFKTVMARGVNGCVRLNESVVQAMEAFNAIAPAHNPPYIAGIRIFAKRLPSVPLIGLFETAFYQWIPEAARLYAVPPAWCEAGVRRWGFHGASHKYIAERSAELMGRPDVAERVRRLYVDDGATPVHGPPFRVISCHLGGSSSVTGIRDGVAIGNSMGMSPQSGIAQNNRVGDLDSFAVPFVMRTLGLKLEEVERQLCRGSGLEGLSGLSNDIRDLVDAAGRRHAEARRALDVFIHDIRRWIGAYLVELNGTDALVFTAGIGENQPGVRSQVTADLDRLGIGIDEERNCGVRAVEQCISPAGSPVQVWVIPTNEELVVAREVRRHLEAHPAS